MVIPTYNEAENIEQLSKRLLQILSQYGLDFEIIIVDDDSPDSTWQIAGDLAQKDPRIKVIRRIGERGLGTAVIAGWNSAEGELLGAMDGDLQHPPEIIPAILTMMKANANLDIIIACRNIKGGGIARWSLFRKTISWIGAAISAFFLPDILFGVHDPMSGYFVLRKKVIQGITLKPIGYKILLEVLARGNYQRIAEYPYYFQERPSGENKAGLNQYFTSLLHILRLSINAGQFLKSMGIMAIGLMGLAITMLAYLLFSQANFALVLSYLFALELANIHNFIWLRFVIFRKRYSDRRLKTPRQLILFHSRAIYAGIFGVSLYLFLIYILHLYHVTAAMIGTLAVFICNMLGRTSILSSYNAASNH